MDIQSLTLHIHDQDVARLAAELVQEPEGMEDLAYRLTPEGLRVQGSYATGFGFKVHFETLWQVVPLGPCLRISLEALKVGGIPAGMVRGVLMRMIRDVVETHEGIRMTEDEAILVDIPAVARQNGVPLNFTFQRVQMSFGTAIVEAGSPLSEKES